MKISHNNSHRNNILLQGETLMNELSSIKQLEKIPQLSDSKVENRINYDWKINPEATVTGILNFEKELSKFAFVKEEKKDPRVNVSLSPETSNVRKNLFKSHDQTKSKR